MTARFRPRLVPGILVGTLVPVLAQTVSPPTAQQLLLRLGEAWGSARLRMEATMTVSRPGQPDLISELRIDRDGSERARIEFLSPPKDEGKVILVVRGRMWLYLPRARKVVEVSRRQNPLAGGLMFDDLSPERLQGMAPAVTDSDGAYVLELAPRGRGGLGPSRIFFDKASLLPVRRDYLSPSGKLLRQVLVEQTRLREGAPAPSRIRIVNTAEGGSDVRLDIGEASAMTSDDEGLFDPARLGQGGPKRAPSQTDGPGVIP